MTMWDWGTGLHWWGWVLGIAATLIFCALVIWSIVALVSRARGPRRGSPPRRARAPARSAPGGLARQYVAGDIDGAEYDRQLAALHAPAIAGRGPRLKCSPHARPYAGAGRD